MQTFRKSKPDCIKKRKVYKTMSRDLWQKIIMNERDQCTHWYNRRQPQVHCGDTQYALPIIDSIIDPIYDIGMAWWYYIRSFLELSSYMSPQYFWVIYTVV